jgi:hypothetical protein
MPPKKKPVTLPPELDDDDEIPAFCTPDDDGWIHLSRRNNASAGPDHGHGRKAGKDAPGRPGKNAGKKARGGKRRRSHD